MSKWLVIYSRTEFSVVAETIEAAKAEATKQAAKLDKNIRSWEHPDIYRLFGGVKNGAA